MDLHKRYASSGEVELDELRQGGANRNEACRGQHFAAPSSTNEERMWRWPGGEEGLSEAGSDRVRLLGGICQCM